MEVRYDNENYGRETYLEKIQVQSNEKERRTYEVQQGTIGVMSSSLLLSENNRTITPIINSASQQLV
jgi:hypothetical protein